MSMSLRWRRGALVPPATLNMLIKELLVLFHMQLDTDD